MLTSRLDQAFTFAREIHEGTVRKGTPIPYLSQLLQVSGLVLEFCGDEDEAIAGLLHDAAEDEGGERMLLEIERRFGAKVAGIVRENSDSLAEDDSKKAPWQERKDAYLAAIPHKTESACIVSLADKIHNARSLLSDQIEFGDSHWSRFNVEKGKVLWYYVELSKRFSDRAGELPRLERAARELVRVVEELCRSAG